MSSPYSLSFGSLPSILPSYARIVFRRKLAVMPDGAPIPRLEARLARHKPSRARVDAYRKVCGGVASEYLPAAYPHVLATPVQLALLSSKAFPVRLMGLVHLRNHIEHFRPVRIDETLQLHTWLDGRRDTDRGQEFDVHTKVLVDGKPVWAEICVFMARRLERDTSKPFGSRISAGEGVPAPDAEAVAPPGPEGITRASLTADKGVGWRYARTSSDYNPIHLADFGARMFGFNQTIAHGMWSMARCLSALPAGTFDSPCRVDVVFKRPVSIPAPLTLETWHTGAGDGFALKGAGKGKVHLAGSVTPLQTSGG
ncbi:MAG: MaoC/PaaZ C-terminal domain-containing protein [Gammaproteobacteria bacterium]